NWLSVISSLVGALWVVRRAERFVLIWCAIDDNLQSVVDKLSEDKRRASIRPGRKRLSCSS
ncbi:hypothetical protein N5D52_26970, partial [Pseudomonas sp. GD03860]